MTRRRINAADYLALGDYNAICDRCGQKFKASHLKLTWEGLRTCSECWEPRQPQDFARGGRDEQTPEWTRPVPAVTWIPGQEPD